MKAKKKNLHIFYEGAATTFDILGVGFIRHRNPNVIQDSWHRVGTYFQNGFAEVKCIDDEKKNEYQEAKALECDHGR